MILSHPHKSVGKCKKAFKQKEDIEMQLLLGWSPIIAPALMLQILCAGAEGRSEISWTKITEEIIVDNNSQNP